VLTDFEVNKMFLYPVDQLKSTIPLNY